MAPFVSTPPVFSNPAEILCPKCGSEMVARTTGNRIWACDDCGFGFLESEAVIGVSTYIPSL